MSKSNTNLGTQKGHVQTEADPSSLKGTLLFTLFVGLFIVASWSAIFLLFSDRV